MPEAAGHGFEEAMDYLPREVGMCPGRWGCAQDQAQSGELPRGWQRGFTPAGRSTLPLPFLALCAPRDLEVQPIFIRGQNMGEKHSLLWEMGSWGQGSAALVSRAGRQHPTVTLSQGMIPYPVDALLPCPGQLSLTWQESCGKGIEGKAEEAGRREA